MKFKEIVKTKYGVLEGIESYTVYKEGNIYECVLNKQNILNTKYGKLIPSYDDSDEGKRIGRSVEFYENGEIKVILLDSKTKINTSIGEFEVEKITFYPNGNIKRIFPFNKKISGFFNVDEEVKKRKYL
ncbi:MAG: hypothetical protein PWP46_942 [Fusobacteriaceae bacterium]|jgi:antitoxin component YwqK of YwqJK toxin-antitoxin module|nr:repeat protein [Fusobacteriales bacterium]MDN5304063.1 hypothetical protein [Fusobacteriaceae bacterium]